MAGILLCLGGEDAGDAGEHALDAGDLGFEVAEAGGGKTVDAGGTAFGGDAGLRPEPAFAEHALERGVERAFLDLEKVAGNLLDVADQRIAVHGLAAEGLEDHEFERAGEEVAVLGVFRHGRNGSAKYLL
jgi:hypothetical protein